jgi:hypothetical protein
MTSNSAEKKEKDDHVSKQDGENNFNIAQFDLISMCYIILFQKKWNYTLWGNVLFCFVELVNY